MTEHDDRMQTIQTSFEQALGEMLRRLDELDDGTATRNPPEGWNAAQIGWHVALTNEFLSSVLRGDVRSDGEVADKCRGVRGSDGRGKPGALCTDVRADAFRCRILRV